MQRSKANLCAGSTSAAPNTTSFPKSRLRELSSIPYRLKNKALISLFSRSFSSFLNSAASVFMVEVKSLPGLLETASLNSDSSTSCWSGISAIVSHTSSSYYPGGCYPFPKNTRKYLAARSPSMDIFSVVLIGTASVTPSRAKQSKAALAASIVVAVSKQCQDKTRRVFASRRNGLQRHTFPGCSRHKS